MNLAIETEAATGVLRLAGALDIYAAEQLHEALKNRVGRAGEIAIDLAGIESCDTAGAQLLLSARRTAAGNSRAVRFESVSPAISRCCHRLGLPEAL